MSTFVREVAKYFMDFLETDFKKQRFPKRQSTSLKNQDYQIGIDIDSYPSLKKKILQLSSHIGGEEFVIKKGEHRKEISPYDLKYIKTKIQQIPTVLFDEMLEENKTSIELHRDGYISEFTEYAEKAQEFAGELFQEKILEHITDDLDFLTKYFDKDLILNDLVELFLSIIDTELKDVLLNYKLDSVGYDLKVGLSAILDESEIKTRLIKYFEELTTKDLFSELTTLKNNKSALDKFEFYLYLHEITYKHQPTGRRYKFPIFYIPINITSSGDQFKLVFDSRVFVNLKAIYFISETIKVIRGTQTSLKGEIERIQYFGNDLLPVITEITKKIAQSFHIDIPKSFFDAKTEKYSNLEVGITNHSYFFIFDKSDEALLNDYEEILNDPDLLQEYHGLLHNFIHLNAESITQNITHEWNRLDIPDKLVFESPVPLNSEQKQIIMALRDDQSKYFIVEGPPGTGKSHTITAIICEAILSGRSVLVLSDKNEALDVVAAKISETLNKVRVGESMQNPILRLGKFQNTLYSIVQAQSLRKIRDHLNSFESEEQLFISQKELLIKEIKSNIETDIFTNCGIEISDIVLYLTNEDKFANYFQIYNVEDDQTRNDIIQLRRSLKNIQNSKAKFYVGWVFDFDIAEIKDHLSKIIEILDIKKEFSKYSQERFLDLYSTDRKKVEAFAMGVADFTTKFSELSTSLTRCSIPRLDKIDTTADIFEVNKILHAFKGLKLKLLKIEGMNYVENIPLDLWEQFKIPNSTTFSEAYNTLRETLNELRAAKKPIIGFLFAKKSVENFNIQIRRGFHNYHLTTPAKVISELMIILSLFESVNSELSDGNDDERKEAFNFIKDKTFHDPSLDTNVSRFLSVLNQHLAPENAGFSIDDVLDMKKYIQLYMKVLKLDQVSRPWVSTFTRPNINLEHKNISKYEEYIESISYFIGEFEKALLVKDELAFVQNFKRKYPVNTETIELFTNGTISGWRSKLDKVDESTLITYLQHIIIKNKLVRSFQPKDQRTFGDQSQALETQVTFKLMSILDKSIINYNDNYGNDLQNLKTHLRRKLKFPKGLFENMKNAFPCILAGVRDYAEYIPLEKDLFDLIIIDEASQVNIAQTLPALIRGKKIVVLGDDKQFSNVKSYNAKKETNNEYKNQIAEVFRREIPDSEDIKGSLNKVVENIDIKISILKFMHSIKNYQTMLKKHFRCYPEIISYSDKNFYEGSLEPMRIRAQDITEVIKFDIVEIEGKQDVYQNINSAEADFIIEKFKLFHKKQIDFNLGIITPHREQVKYLLDRISKLDINDWLFRDKKLKVMTFDTCQGEERDYIFYSMVASNLKDRLNYIFPVSFQNLQNEEEGSLRAQRLNVGFSRARNTVHFVLSKSPEEFNGEIGKALLHYQHILENTTDRIHGHTDPRSPMEEKVLHYLEQTPFFKDNMARIQIYPQYEVGKNIRDFHNSTNIRDYVVDFLLLFDDQKIVIEYDGFREHFIDNGDEINIANYSFYMNENDVYRQKVLESYGYKFLRLNKFNLGDAPIDFISEQLTKISRPDQKKNPNLGGNGYEGNVRALQEGTKRHCENCKIVYPVEYFPYRSKKLCLECYDFTSERRIPTKRAEIVALRGLLKGIINEDQKKTQLTIDKVKEAIKSQKSIFIGNKNERYWVKPYKVHGVQYFFGTEADGRSFKYPVDNYKLISMK